MKKMMTALAALGLTISVSGGVHAAGPNLVTNGSFELTSNGPGELNTNTTVTGWATTGYNFVFAAGTANTTGARQGSSSSTNFLKLWGPGGGVGSSTYSNNGMPASSPDGGNFVAADGAYQTAPITQTINGLIVGHTYQLTFNWAGAQQSGFTGPTTDQWIVKLGTDTQSTSIASLASHGFAPWKGEAFNYTATATSEVLSFLASGTPTGTPPFALLDGVSLTEAPEPSSLAAMFIGMLGLVAIIRRTRTKKSIA